MKTIKDLILYRIPDELELKYGKEGQREWYEYWVGDGKFREAIVIQRNDESRPFYIYIISGDAVRTLDGVFWSIDDAIKELENYGIKAKGVK